MSLGHEPRLRDRVENEIFRGMARAQALRAKIIRNCSWFILSGVPS